MLLKMVIEERVLDEVPVEPKHCKQVGYLSAMQECLLQKHEATIRATGMDPPFYLQASSKMNLEGYTEDA